MAASPLSAAPPSPPVETCPWGTHGAGEYCDSWHGVWGGAHALPGAQDRRARTCTFGGAHAVGEYCPGYGAVWDGGADAAAAPRTGGDACPYGDDEHPVGAWCPQYGSTWDGDGAVAVAAAEVGYLSTGAGPRATRADGSPVAKGPLARVGGSASLSVARGSFSSPRGGGAAGVWRDASGAALRSPGVLASPFAAPVAKQRSVGPGVGGNGNSDGTGTHEENAQLHAEVQYLRATIATLGRDFAHRIRALEAQLGEVVALAGTQPRSGVRGVTHGHGANTPADDAVSGSLAGSSSSEASHACPFGGHHSIGQHCSSYFHHTGRAVWDGSASAKFRALASTQSDEAKRHRSPPRVSLTPSPRVVRGASSPYTAASRGIGGPSAPRLRDPPGRPERAGTSPHGSGAFASHSSPPPSVARDTATGGFESATAADTHRVSAAPDTSFGVAGSSGPATSRDAQGVTAAAAKRHAERQVPPEMPAKMAERVASVKEDYEQALRESKAAEEEWERLVSEYSRYVATWPPQPHEVGSDGRPLPPRHEDLAARMRGAHARMKALHTVADRWLAAAHAAGVGKLLVGEVALRAKHVEARHREQAWIAELAASRAAAGSQIPELLRREEDGRALEAQAAANQRVAERNGDPEAASRYAEEARLFAVDARVSESERSGLEERARQIREEEGRAAQAGAEAESARDEEWRQATTKNNKLRRSNAAVGEVRKQRTARLLQTLVSRCPFGRLHAAGEFCRDYAILTSMPMWSGNLELELADITHVNGSAQVDVSASVSATSAGIGGRVGAARRVGYD